MKKEEKIEWAIKEIKELEFLVNEFIELDPSIDFNFTVDITPVVEQEVILFSITVNYLNATRKDIVMRGKVMTIFQIKEMESITLTTAEGKPLVDLPEQLWIALFSIAFTHTRALLAKSSAGTRYAHMLLPVINPEEQFKKLFGPLLKGSEKQKK
jgi:hypothetical protein